MKLTRTRLLVLSSGCLAVAILIIFLVTRNSLVKTQYDFVKNESQKVNHIFSLLVDETLNKKHKELINASTNKRINTVDDFIAIFVMSNNNGKLVEKFANSTIQIPNGFGHVILNKFSNLESKINLHPIKSSDGTDLITMITKYKGDILIGLFENKFSSMLQKFILDHSEVVLINKLGYILASSSTQLQEKIQSSITLAIQNKSFNEKELFHYSDRNREMLSKITSVSDTNLYASVLTPQGIIYSSANEVSKNILIIGIAVILIGAGIILAFSVKFEKPIKQPLAKPTDPYEVKTSIKKRYASLEQITKSELGNQRKDAFREFSSFISSKATGPLASAIGHIQIIKAKNTTPTLERHLDKAQKSVRDVQDIVSKLTQFSGTDLREKISLDINQTLQDTIKLMEFNLTGITVTTNYNKPKPVLANPAQLKQVFYDLLSKIFDDMELISTSELVLETKNIDELIYINFKFLSNENFDPLPYNDKNLNLAACVGIIEEHQGSISSSLDGSNVVITVTLPTLNKDSYLKNQILTSINISNELTL